MIHLRGAVGAMALAVMATGFPQKSLADGLKGHDFLTWSEEGQNNYIQTAVTMASFVMSRSNAVVSECLNTWYAGDRETMEEQNEYIRRKISSNAEYHPSAVILVVLENACGSFGGN